MEQECRYCGINLVDAEGELVCPSCGWVAGRPPYKGPEWKTYSPRERERRARTGAPLTPLLHDLGLTTQNIGIKPERRERRLMEALSHLHGAAGKLGLSGAVEKTAASILRKAASKTSNRMSVQTLALASLYIASRIHGIPRGMGELSSSLGMREVELARAFGALSKLLGFKPPERRMEDVASRLVKALSLNGEVLEESLKMYERLKSMGLTQGRKPESLASACLYLAAKKLGCRVNQRKVASEAHISTSTLRRTLNLLKAQQI